MQENRTPLESLRKLVITQKTAVMPSETDDPAMKDLHAALTHYDQLVSENVIQAIQGKSVNVPQEQITAAQQQLDRQLAAPEIITRRELEQYRKYKNRLDQMIDLVITISTGSSQPWKGT